MTTKKKATTRTPSGLNLKVTSTTKEIPVSYKVTSETREIPVSYKVTSTTRTIRAPFTLQPPESSAAKASPTRKRKAR